MAKDEQDEIQLFSNVEMARFSAAIAAYRIIRLSVELFLVIRVQELAFTVSHAGTIFLIYSIASIVAGLIFLWFPTICFGSRLRACTFFGLSTAAMFGGFISMFQVQSFGWMSVFAVLTGFGTASWNINFQTITNTAFPKAQLGSVARMRQLLECVGFLLPSICLALVVRGTHGSASSSSFVSQTATVLGIVGLAFAVLSADQLIQGATRAAHRRPTTEDGSADSKEDQPAGIWDSLKTFFGTSVVLYFLLFSLLLSVSNLLMGTMSLITETFFGLDAEWLWLAAIAFPIGGMISVAIQMLRPTKPNSKSVALVGLQRLMVVFATCILLGLLSWPSRSSSHATAKAMLFVFGLVVGMIYSVAFTANVELWLRRLKDCDTSFVSRASVINNLGTQAIIAMIFQLQTILVDAVSSAASTKANSHHQVAEMIIFFAPLIVLCVFGWFITRQMPCPKDSIFGYPFSCSFSTILMTVVGLLEALELPSAANSLFFSSFYDFRTARLSPHLKKSTIQRGPLVAAGTSLSPSSLQEHLQTFDKLNTGEEWWASSSQSSTTKLCNILISNEEAMTERLELIAKAKSSIWMVTWLIEDSPTGRRLANALIERAKQGVNVQIMVDAVTLYYLHQKFKLRGMNDMGTLYHKLIEGGVAVCMLDDLHEESAPAFVIGNHRKIMMVDHQWVITGGRNNSDGYFTTEGSYYHDADITLHGDFSNSTSILFQKLWNQARDIRPLLQDLKVDSIEEKDTSNDLVDNRTTDFASTDISSIGDSDLEDLELAEGGGLVAGAMTEHQTVTETMSIGHQQCTGTPISLFQLDHKAGNKNGYDIIFSSLLFLVETAQERIDLILGYFQLFPELEKAIKRAVKRGVKVRLVTNSAASNALPAFNLVFGQALERLLDLDNVQVYVAGDEYKDDGDFCFHYKVGLFDQKAGLVGSWNCLGTSVFYDSDFSVVMFDDNNNNNNGGQQKHAFQEFEDLIDESIKVRRVVPMKEVRSEDFHVPLYYWLLSSKSGARQMKRGF